MGRSLIRSVGPGMALLALGLLASAVVELGSDPGLAYKSYSPAKTPASNKPQVVENYGKLPLSFEANQGQTDNRVDFLSRGSGYTLFLTPTEAVLALRKPPASEVGKVESNVATEEAVLRMKLVGANASPRVSGLEELPGKSNYFIGNDPKKWRTNVPHYAKVQYRDVYPGVDLVYYGNQRQLEYDLIVAPGANPELIQFAFEGEEDLEIDAQGDLVLHTAGEEVRLHKPLVYQQVAGARREISGAYALNGGRQVSFEVAAYDASKLLIIDPVLEYSTYLGGSGTEAGTAITVDTSGNAYLTGSVSGLDFPTASPFQVANAGGEDVFLTKLNAAGSALIYSTYLGGSGEDGGGAIAVDASGNAYVTGDTNSTDFPTASPIQSAFGGGNRDAFVAKLNAAGNAFVYSTYLGGGALDRGAGVAVDTSGNAYVTGESSSDDFPTTPGAFQMTYNGGLKDAFVAKLSAAGTALLYSTYLGGTGGEGGSGIAVDTTGNAHITGTTFSADFPTTPEALQSTITTQPAFITKLSTTGDALVYSTFLGGSGIDQPSSIAVGPAGNAYITGGTHSTDFPTTPGAFQRVKGTGNSEDAFVAKINPQGTALVYSTYLGGSEAEGGFDVAIDSSGNAYLTGITLSADFPTTPGAFQTALTGNGDAFVTKLNAEGSGLVYSTYLGGNGLDQGSGIGVGTSGSTYVTGSTGSTDFPTASPIQPAKGGSRDAFVAKIADLPLGMNVQVPAGVPAGTQEVEIIVNGVPGNTVTIAVQ